MATITQHMSKKSTLMLLHKLLALAPAHPNFESANLAPLPHYKMASHPRMLLMNPTEAIQTPNVSISIACKKVHLQPWPLIQI
jgi:hypothetical protein